MIWKSDVMSDRNRCFPDSDFEPYRTSGCDITSGHEMPIAPSEPDVGTFVFKVSLAFHQL